MLGMLKVSLGGNSIPGRRRFPSKGEVFFHHLLCVAVDPYSLAIVPIALEPRFPASAAIPVPLRSLRIRVLSHDIQAQTLPSLGVTFRPPKATKDHCMDLRAVSLDYWNCDPAVSSLSLAARHPFVGSDPNIAPSLRHAFNSSTSACASFISAFG